MGTRLALFIVLALAVASAACQPRAQEAGPLSDEDVAAIQALPELYAEAMLAGDYAAVAARYTKDAVFMRPNAPLIEGRAAIQASYESIPGAVTAYANTPVQIEGRGDLAYARGTIEMTVAVDGLPEPVSDTIKYITILRKQPDGRWLLSAVCWNSDLPLPMEGEQT